MGYTAPNWVNGKPPAINAARLNDLCSTVQTLDETMPTKQDKLTFDDTPRANSSNPVKSSGIYTALQGKQGTLTFDSAPTQGSNNPVTSGGIYTAIQQGGGGGTITMDDVPTAGSSNPVKSSGIYTALQGKQDALTFDTSAILGSTNPVTSDGIYKHYIGAGRRSESTVGLRSTAEGYNTTASGSNSHAEGSATTASSSDSHAEGYNTTASGAYSHAEGQNTTASEVCAHAEGRGTTASGYESHAEGDATTASGNCSHAEGYATEAAGNNQHVFGQLNVSNTTDVEIVGWGTSSTRKNIRTLDTSGNMTIAGTLTQSSDAQLKTVEGEIPDVSEIHAVRFRWNDVNGQHDDIDHVGYIAQDVEEVAPFMVKEDSNGYKALDYIAFLCAKMELLERRVKELEEKKE